MRNRIWELIKKYGIPAAGIGLSAEGFFRNKRETYRDKLVEEAIKKGVEKQKALEESKRLVDKYVHQLKAQYTAGAEKVESTTAEVKHYTEKIAETTEKLKLNSGNTNQTENNNFQTILTHYNREQGIALQKQSQAIKELQNLNNTSTEPDIFKSDLSEFFNNFIDNYREFLSTLTSEQLAILVNLWGLLILGTLFTSIITILIGDKIIQYFKLETKYPKLAEFIKIKQKINQFSLIFYIVLFYIVLIIIVSLNVLMFSYNYLYL